MEWNSRSSVSLMISKTKCLLDAQKCLNRIIGPHDLITTNDKENLNFSFQGTLTNRMVVGELIYGKDVIFKTQANQAIDHYCITRPVVGTPIFYKNGVRFITTYQHATIVSPQDKFEINVEHDCIQSFISFDKSFVESVLIDLIDEKINEALVFKNTMQTLDPRILAWWNLIESSHNMLLTLKNVALAQEIKKDFEYVIVKSLLLSQPSNYSEKIHKRYHDAPEYFNRAIKYISENIKFNICINELEHISGISKTKLSSTFKKHTGLNLQNYIKNYRLKCINREILASSPTGNITYIALKWGVKHLGRFSIDYKQVFGESPSITLKRMSQSL